MLRPHGPPRGHPVRPVTLILESFLIAGAIILAIVMIAVALTDRPGR